MVLRLSSGFLIAGLFFASFGTAVADLAVNTGDCVIINQSIEMTSGSVLNQELDCIPEKPEDAFRVRYVWLDSNSASFVLAGAQSEELKKLLGSDPVLVRNEVTDELREIWKNFATKVTDNGYVRSSEGTYFTQSIAGKGGLQDGPNIDLGSVPSSALRRMRFYAANEKIIWPMPKVIREEMEKSKFAERMKITYGNEGIFSDSAAQYLHRNKRNYFKFTDRVFECTVMYDFLNQNDFDNYWNDVDKLLTDVERDGHLSRFIRYVFPSGVESYYYDDNKNILSLNAMGYFAREGWPKDFILRYYYLNPMPGCTYIDGFSALPRELFVKVAVIQAKEGGFDLKGYSYRSEERFNLRKKYDFSSQESKEKSLGEIGRSGDQSVLIPIGIELRYDLSLYPFRLVQENRDSAVIRRQIQNFPYKDFQLRSRDRSAVLASKSRSAFSAPQFTEITRTYKYGPALEIDSILVGKTNVNVRPAPAVASLMNGFFEEGSCPFLYFVLESGETLKHGRVLVGANDESRKMSQRVEIPKNTVSILIREEEPEVSFLDSVAIESNDGRVIGKMAEFVRLNPGMQLKFDLEDAIEKTDTAERRYVRVKGFYRTLNSLSHNVAPQ